MNAHFFLLLCVSPLHLLSLPTPQPSVSDDHVKLVAIGESATGAKTSAVNRFFDGTFDDGPMPTMGAAFRTKRVTLGNDLYKLFLWDTAGQERFVEITVLYARNADVIYLGYDITDRGSFACLKDRLARAQAPPGVVIVLVGNKCDLEDRHREVSKEEGLELAAELSAPGSASWADIMSGACGPESWDLADGTVPFFEISAKEDINIHKSFMTAAIFSAARKEGADRSLLKRELMALLS